MTPRENRKDGIHDALVVGAGMAGLTAAADLARRGRSVLVVDKARGVGGRLATRRLGEAACDHGAQFITVRGKRFAAAMAAWHEAGLARVWYRGLSGGTDGHPRWCGVPGMAAIAKQLARGRHVRLGHRAVAVRKAGAAWEVIFEDGGSAAGRALVLTPPAPQSLALLDAGHIILPGELRRRIAGLAYERCLAVMAVLDGPSGLLPPGAVSPEEGPLAWIADNQAKGVSAVPAVTLHATGTFSAGNWERDRAAVGQELLTAARPWIAARAVQVQVHGWRYSKPVNPCSEPCLVLEEDPPLVLAGDAFGGPKVEGAARSGWAAAAAVDRRLTQET